MHRGSLTTSDPLDDQHQENQTGNAGGENEHELGVQLADQPKDQGSDGQGAEDGGDDQQPGAGSFTQMSMRMEQLKLRFRKEFFGSSRNIFLVAEDLEPGHDHADEQEAQGAEGEDLVQHRHAHETVQDGAGGGTGRLGGPGSRSGVSGNGIGLRSGSAQTSAAVGAEGLAVFYAGSAVFTEHFVSSSHK